MKKRIVAIIALSLIFTSFMTTFVYGASSSAKDITIYIENNTENGEHEEGTKHCIHYYMVKQGEKVIIRKTALAVGQKNTFTLPKIEGGYTMVLSKEYTDKNGKSRKFVFMGDGDPRSMDGSLGDIGSSDKAKFFVGCPRDYTIDQEVEEVDTKASATAGSVGVAVATAIVLGAGGVAATGAASVAGVAAGTSSLGGSDTEGSEESGESTYKMVLYKEFGDAIRYNEQPVFIYARMVEVTPDGEEIDRIDLTNKIRIFSKDSDIKVGQTTISSDSVVASLEAEASTLAEAPSTGIVSFEFQGAGGLFRNNVEFRLIGEAAIGFEGKHSDQLYIQSGSNQTYSLGVKPMDFVKPAKLRIGTMTTDMPFDVKLEQSKEGQYQLIVTDQSEKLDQIKQFYENFNVEVIGENDFEKAQSMASLILCHEGLLADFIDGKKEVKGYKDRETDRMAETIVDFRLGLYDTTQETLVFQTPEDLAFTYSDEARICEIIGLEAEVDKEWDERNAIRYKMLAKKPFPSDHEYTGDFSAMCRLNDKYYEYNAPVALKPDVQIYNEMAEVEEEYQNCIYMIKSYLPQEKGEQLIAELNEKRNKYKYGARDYQIYRQFVWNRAQNYIMNEHRDYMRESAFYDDMICICEWTKWIGDIAFEMALMPFGGPLAGFVLSNGKNLLISVTDIYITKGTIETKDVVQYITGVLGGLDGVVSTTPSPSEYKKLALWLMAFFAYRVVYHRAYSSDDKGKRIDSWYDAIGLGFKDLAVKGLLASFGSMVMGGADDTLSVKTGKNTRVTYHKYQDDEMMKPLTDIGDGAIDAVNSQLDIWLSKLYQFLDDVVDGKIVL